mgnify:CR=1 FL=1
MTVCERTGIIGYRKLHFSKDLVLCIPVLPKSGGISMKKSVYIAIVSVLAVALLGSAIYLFGV